MARIKALVKNHPLLIQCITGTMLGAAWGLILPALIPTLSFMAKVCLLGAGGSLLGIGIIIAYEYSASRWLA